MRGFRLLWLHSPRLRSLGDIRHTGSWSDGECGPPTSKDGEIPGEIAEGRVGSGHKGAVP